MADFVKGFFAAQKPAQAASGADDDFADFAGAPSPEPASLSSTLSAAPSFQTATINQVPYTKWYRVWERATLDDFKLEMYILPFVLVVVVVHLWGTRSNRKIAKTWLKAHGPVLEQEFAQVGYIRPQATVDDVSEVGLLQASEKAKKDAVNPDLILREKKADEYTSYATGRQNVAFVDLKLTLSKRYNPMMRLGEFLIGAFFESMPATEERLEATAYPFDGREAQIVPKGEDRKSAPNSTFDGFVWAIVHKDLMKRLRDDRYDLSLTSTKDHAKLPVWVTVMSESAEITDKLLTPELIKAVTDAGDKFEAFIISDQPMDQPKKLDDTIPRKRINLSLKLSSSAAEYEATLPLFSYFLRMSDHLVSTARFRPEAMRRVKAAREEQIAKIKRLDDDEKAEERKLTTDKMKKEKRDQLLSRMTADEQRKYLDKERERDVKKREKRKTMKG
ncbi:DUF1682-domain-containing protein [Amniculicola lignicola CBS 123094]|uniref:DUF1682-domain-containing protein n=1 Tax=Amniculicola lignicola CBS 123094 TaxID=1392246 RepID=A0A6A5WSH8_9PLEO|nr:DUF1682-domain-containing protein [Amniculicola lignicola CBS 123094]